MVIIWKLLIWGFDQEGILYEEWAKHYDKYIAAALKDFYQIKVKEQNNPATENAILRITWEELAQRTYEMELFIQTYKDQKLISEDASWLYGNYMNALVMGTNGTPIFNYETHAFSEAAKTAYAAFINKHGDSTTAWALKEYFTYWTASDILRTITIKYQAMFFDTVIGWCQSREREFFNKWMTSSGSKIW